MHQHEMETLDATGADAMFGDDDINFNLQLEKFGVRAGMLNEPAVERIFRSWVGDWEEEARKQNDYPHKTNELISQIKILLRYLH